MSRARLVITAVVVQGRPVTQVADQYGLHRAWVYKLLARYRQEGEAAFEPRSRHPRTTPKATPSATVELILKLREDLTSQGHDAGPETIRWHLHTHHQVTVSRATIARILTRAGLVTPEPKKKPKSAYIRFEADQPNAMWQSDFTHYRLADGTDTEIITWLDDHSRYALHISGHQTVTGVAVLPTFRQAMHENGIPASTLTDNGMVYTVRLSGHGRQGGRTALENELRQLNITQKNSQPNHPTTCGKVERFQQTMKNWLRAQPPPATLTDLQVLLDTWRHQYNHQRPHRSLNRRTPAAAYTTRPKSTPTGTNTNTHDRVRRDRVDKTGKVILRVQGRLFHIGIGRAHARTPVILLVQDLNITVINAVTGELLRQLTLDPTRGYQPQNAKQPEP